MTEEQYGRIENELRIPYLCRQIPAVRPGVDEIAKQVNEHVFRRVEQSLRDCGINEHNAKVIQKAGGIQPLVDLWVRFGDDSEYWAMHPEELSGSKSHDEKYDTRYKL